MKRFHGVGVLGNFFKVLLSLTYVRCVAITVVNFVNEFGFVVFFPLSI